MLLLLFCRPVMMVSQDKAAKKPPKKKQTASQAPRTPTRHSSRLGKKAADTLQLQKEDLAEVFAEMVADLVDEDEIPEEEPWAFIFCDHVNPHDEPRCAMERITPHAAPTSWTGPALSHPHCPCCTFPCPPDAQQCPVCNEVLLND